MRTAGKKLFVASIIAGTLIGIALFARAWQQMSADKRICSKVDRLAESLITVVQSGSDPAALKRFSYYRKHPGEIEQAVKRNREAIAIIRRASCNPRSFDLLNS